MGYKKEVVQIAKKCFNVGLTTGTSGNVSVREGEVMYITPSALPYNEMQESDVLKVNIKTGEVMEGHRNPSSETSMHRFIYLEDQKVEAIVHTHSTYATMFACAHKPIPPVHYTIADIGRQVPVAAYARYGTEKLAKNVVETLTSSNGNGVLLANHGVVAIGKTLSEAFRRAEVIEEVAQFAYGSHTLNNVKALTTEELDDALEGFKTYVSG